MPIYGLHEQLLPPSGAAFAVACQLVPAANYDGVTDAQHRALVRWRAHRGELVGHVVTARADSLSIFELRKQSLRTPADVQDAEHLGDVQAFLLKRHNLFGSVTGLAAVRTAASETDGADRIAVSFKDAKIALLEFSLPLQDLTTLSIHTYERTPELLLYPTGLPLNFQPLLRADPLSRCTALSLPGDALAVLPFAGAGDDALGFLDELWDEDDLYGDSSAGPAAQRDGRAERELPYNPSFVVRLSELGGAAVSAAAAFGAPSHASGSGIKNVRDFVFLPGFQKPTLAVLFEPRPTCTGLLSESKDTFSLFLLTLDLSSGFAGDASSASGSTLTLISSRDSLPYDSLYLTACPESIGGAVIVTSTAVVHIDQSGQAVGVAFSRWWPKLSALQGVKMWEEDQDLDLHDSQFAFMPRAPGATSAAGQSEKAMLALRDGRLFELEFSSEGRSVAAIKVRALGTSTQPSALAFLTTSAQEPERWLWVASMVGDTEVLRVDSVAEDDAGEANGTAAAAPQEEEDEMDMDLYGPSAGAESKAAAGAAQRTRLQLTPSTHIAALGPIADLTPSAEAEEAVPLAQTVALTGARASGGITRFEPKLKPRKRRRVDTDGTLVSDVWSVGSSGQHAAMRLLASSDAEGVSLLLSTDRDGVVAHTAELKGTTVFAAALPQTSGLPDRDFLRVTASRAEIRAADGGQLRAQLLLNQDEADSITSATFAFPYLQLRTSRDKIRLAVVSLQSTTPQIREVRLPEQLDKKADILQAQLFRDDSGLLSVSIPSGSAATAKTTVMDEDEVDYEGDEDAGKGAQSSLVDIDSAAASNLWLSYLTATGEFRLLSLARPDYSWCSTGVPFVPWRLEHSTDAAKTSSVAEAASVSDVRLVTMAQVPHLAVLLDNQQLHVYEFSPFEERAGGSAGTFVKVLGKQLSTHGIDVFRAPNGDAPERESARIRPLQRDSVFLTGTSPGLLKRTSHGVPQFHDCDGDFVHDATAVDQYSACAFVETGQVILADIPDLCYDLPIPYTREIIGRTYTKATAHPSTQALVVASVIETPFQLFNPEDNSLVADPTVDPTAADCYRGSIELFQAGEKRPSSGFALAQNEIVCALELVSLSSVSNEQRSKDYIAVGTAITHGEDRPSKGAIYIFDIIETVPTLDQPDAVPHKLKLVDKEELRGPVTALTEMNGFLVHTVGQRLQAKALENDEWLISVGFLDLAFYVTSMRRVKNYLLLSDVHRSITFVAFQEEPYRLVQLGRDTNNAPVMTANFLLHEEGVSMLTADINGVIRLLDYAPTVLSTQGGQKLLLRTEYQTAAEAACSRAFPAKNTGMGLSIRNELLMGTTCGSIEGVSCVDEETFKKLQLLQNYMTKNVRHFAGLNPRGYRAVANETVPRPLARGILDGALLGVFSSLPRKRGEEMAAVYAQGATPADVAEVLRDSAMQWPST